MSSFEIDPTACAILPVICRSRAWKQQLPLECQRHENAINRTVDCNSPVIALEVLRPGARDGHPDDFDNIYLVLNSRGQLVEMAGRFMCPLDFLDSPEAR